MTIKYINIGKGIFMALIRLQEAMAPIYARMIHWGRITLDDVNPQTEEYREYVKRVYRDLFLEEL